MLQFEIELSFPNCEHKRKITVNAENKYGAERVCKLIIEKQEGLCVNCFNKSK